MNGHSQGIVARLVEVPSGWENGGGFYIRFDGVGLNVDFGDEDHHPRISFRFDWVRSFRYISEATYEDERDRFDVMDALLSEVPLPDPNNPSGDYYGGHPEAGKGSPRLFRIFHYKAGLIEVVASDWCVK
jgi:hypothetical protein